MLDTSAYVGFKRNEAEAVELIVNAERIVFFPVVLGELLFGFRNGSRFKENMDDLNRFLAHESVKLFAIGKTTADRYSRIVMQFKRQGTPIPTNDIWIAAQAMEHGAELIASDRHFEIISGLVHTHFRN